MANYWAITIGINQYRHFQPLMHAQDDALVTHRFLTEEAGIPAAHCVLLSDLTTSVTDKAVYPDKPAVTQWLQTISEQVQADDVLWFFFSGYGVQVDEKDYLMPIDGDPAQAESTGISAAGLVETLAQLPTDNCLLILDINRSQGALAGQAIGTEIIKLAEARSLTTFLSCQPEQYSHETLAVRHGLFTAAFLEAAHQSLQTPAQIGDYLNKRLPELCEHHWRPIQNPVLVASGACAETEVVPELQSTLVTDVSAPVGMAEPIGCGDDYLAEPTSSSEVGEDISEGAVAVVEKPLPAKGENAPPSLIQPPYTEETIATGSYRSHDGLGPVGKDGDVKGSDALKRDAAEEEAMAVTGAKLRNWGLLALALLMGGVLLKQPFVQTAWQGLGERIGGASRQADSERATPLEVADAEAPAASEGPEALSDAENSDATQTAVVPAETDAADEPAEEVDAEEVDAEGADAEAAETETIDSETVQPDTASETASPETAAAEPVDAEAEKAQAQAMITQANKAIEQRQYSEALIALQDVPRSQRDAAFSAVLTKARTGSAEAQQTNASVLTEARTSIQPTQASQFTEAIAKARLIQPGEPYYEAAQRDIRSWSQVILDIAEGRATSGNLDGAIAAGSVMPQDNAELYQKAQDRIAFWQQRQNSRAIIAEAQTIPKLGQASTYQKGIVKLREVPIEHPEYESAQRLADQWSQSIFSIAQARAAQDRQNAAIQAAILVPAGTTAYEPTQQAIRRWRDDS